MKTSTEINSAAKIIGEYEGIKKLAQSAKKLADMYER